MPTHEDLRLAAVRFAKRVPHHAKECVRIEPGDWIGSPNRHETGPCRGADGKTRERRVKERRGDDLGCKFMRGIPKEYRPLFFEGRNERQGQRRGASKGLLAVMADAAACHERSELATADEYRRYAPVSSVESAAPTDLLKRDIGNLLDQWEQVPNDMRDLCEETAPSFYEAVQTLSAHAEADLLYAASSPVPKLVEALRQSLDIVNAALQLSGLREIPANVTRARWLKVYESLNSLVSIEEDAKGEQEA